MPSRGGIALCGSLAHAEEMQRWARAGSAAESKAATIERSGAQVQQMMDASLQKHEALQLAQARRQGCSRRAALRCNVCFALLAHRRSLVQRLVKSAPRSAPLR